MQKFFLKKTIFFNGFCTQMIENENQLCISEFVNVQYIYLYLLLGNFERGWIQWSNIFWCGFTLGMCIKRLKNDRKNWNSHSFLWRRIRKSWWVGNFKITYESIYFEFSHSWFSCSLEKIKSGNFKKSYLVLYPIFILYLGMPNRTRPV